MIGRGRLFVAAPDSFLTKKVAAQALVQLIDLRELRHRLERL